MVSSWDNRLAKVRAVLKFLTASHRIIGSQVFIQRLVQSFDLEKSPRVYLELPLFFCLLNGQCRHSTIAMLSEVRLFAKNPIISEFNLFLDINDGNLTYMKSDAWSVCRKIVR